MKDEKVSKVFKLVKTAEEVLFLGKSKAELVLTTTEKLSNSNN